MYAVVFNWVWTKGELTALRAQSGVKNLFRGHSLSLTSLSHPTYCLLIIVWFYEPQFICAEKLKRQGELSLWV